MVNTRKSSLRLLGSKSPGPGPGPGAGAEPGATGGSSHFISSRTRSSKTRAASCPAAKAGGSGGAGVAPDEARVSARRPESGRRRVPARPPGLCLAGLGQEASSGDRSGAGNRVCGCGGGWHRAGEGRDSSTGPSLLCKEQHFNPGERALGVFWGTLERSAFCVLALPWREILGSKSQRRECPGRRAGEEK